MTLFQGRGEMMQPGLWPTLLQHAQVPQVD
jgi:hypothetical protein